MTRTSASTDASGRRTRRPGAPRGVLLLLLATVLGGCATAAPPAAGTAGSGSVPPTSRPSATAASTPTPTQTQTGPRPLSLVVVGDSIAFNSPADCPGCTGFVLQYAAALEKATGRKVTTTNRSQHNGLTLPGLMAELPTFRDDLSGADAVIVGIAHNSFPLNDERPCGTTFDESTARFGDWSKLDAACSARARAQYQPLYDRLFSTVSGWREGRPTVLLALSKYDDWVGWPKAHFTADQAARIVRLHDAWNSMLCASANRHGFTCADVYHAFNGSRGTRPSGDLLGADYTHPSQKGNDLITKVLVATRFAPLA